MLFCNKICFLRCYVLNRGSGFKLLCTRLQLLFLLGRRHTCKHADVVDRWAWRRFLLCGYVTQCRGICTLFKTERECFVYVMYTYVRSLRDE